MPILTIVSILFIAALIPIMSSSCDAQNAAPSVDRITVSVEGDAASIVVDYDVSDAENDPLTVWLAVSLDSGRTYSRAVGAITGAIGAVQAGAAQRITWQLSDADRARLGARDLRLRIVADDGHEIDVQSIVDRVDSAMLRSTLEAIDGPRNRDSAPAKLESARATIASRFESVGLETSTHRFSYSGTEGVNIIGNAGGLVDGDTIVIIDAHYDTMHNSPGADDNGSGVAGMLEALRAIDGLQFRRGVRAIGFDMEEDGVIGSNRYVQMLTARGVAVEGVLNFEMIGFASDVPNSQTIPPGFSQLFPVAVDSIEAGERRGNFVTIVANAASSSLADAYENAVRRYVPELRSITLTVPGNGQIAPDLRRSDHARFWDGGYAALMLTDGANFRNPNYHTSSDAIGTLNFGFMRNVVRATIGALVELADPMHAGARETDPFSLGLVSSAEPARDRVRTGLSLAQNSPNPFVDNTSIRFVLPRSGTAVLELFDALGRRVAVLVDGQTDAGEYVVDLTASRLGHVPGVYVCRLLFDGEAVQRTMVMR